VQWLLPHPQLFISDNISFSTKFSVEGIPNKAKKLVTPFEGRVMEIKISQKNNGCLSMLDCKDNEYTILLIPDDLEGLKASGLCIGVIVTAMDCAVWTNDGVSFWLRGSANEGDLTPTAGSPYQRHHSPHPDSRWVGFDWYSCSHHCNVCWGCLPHHVSSASPN